MLEVSSHGLVLPNGLRIADVKLKMPTPVLETNPVHLHEGMVIDIEVVVEAADLEAYLEVRRPSGLSGFRVSAENGLLRVIATSKTILPVQVGGEGRLEYADGRLNIVPTRAEVAGMKMPDGLMKEHLARVNPIIDVTGYPIDVNLKRTDLLNGRIHLAGRVTVTASIPRREP
jgi:hypothetical protein